jgi:hypothetical protein
LLLSMCRLLRHKEKLSCPVKKHCLVLLNTLTVMKVVEILLVDHAFNL